jgi:spectrin alpha
MAKQEAFLSNEDLGDSLDSVEALIKKHEDFEKSLAAQEEKIKALDEFASKLIEGIFETLLMIKPTFFLINLF